MGTVYNIHQATFCGLPIQFAKLMLLKCHSRETQVYSRYKSSVQLEISEIGLLSRHLFELDDLMVPALGQVLHFLHDKSVNV